MFFTKTHMDCCWMIIVFSDENIVYLLPKSTKAWYYSSTLI